MSLPDGLIMQYFEYLTDIASADLEEMSRAMEADSVNPMELKKRLAGEITGQFHDAEDARAAAAHFERVVQRREAPEDGQQYLQVMLEGSASTSEVFIMAFPTRSRSELKRLINQGAVEYNGRKIDKEMIHQPGEIIKFGRRQFVKTIDTEK
jgi:tyrosyl-tRNA synthetase